MLTPSVRRGRGPGRRARREEAGVVVSVGVVFQAIARRAQPGDEGILSQGWEEN